MMSIDEARNVTVSFTAQEAFELVYAARAGISHAYVDQEAVKAAADRLEQARRDLVSHQEERADEPERRGINQEHGQP